MFPYSMALYTDCGSDTSSPSLLTEGYNANLGCLRAARFKPTCSLGWTNVISPLTPKLYASLSYIEYAQPSHLYRLGRSFSEALQSNSNSTIHCRYPFCGCAKDSMSLVTSIDQRWCLTHSNYAQLSTLLREVQNPRKSLSAIVFAHSDSGGSCGGGKILLKYP